MAEIKTEAKVVVKPEIKKEAKSLVKIKVDYPKIGEKATLWGIDFEWSKGAYFAELSKDDAEAMVKANRAELVE